MDRKTDNDRLDISFEECIIGSDLHIPGHSMEWVNALLRYAKQHNIRKFVHAGDFFNFDALSRFELKDKKLTLEKELEAGKKLISKLREQFNGIYTVCGNHDKRLPIALKDSISFAEAMKVFVDAKVVATNSDHLFLTSGEITFRICHPESYSQVKGKIAGGLAQDLQENIIMGHPHYFSMTYNRTGKFMAIELPCLCDISAFQYKNRATTNCPEWNNGFLHMRRGHIRPITNLTF